MPEPGSRTETWSLLGEPEAPQRPPDGYLAKATSLVKLFTKGKLSPHPRQSPLSEHRQGVNRREPAATTG